MFQQKVRAKQALGLSGKASRGTHSFNFEDAKIAAEPIGIGHFVGLNPAGELIDLEAGATTLISVIGIAVFDHYLSSDAATYSYPAGSNVSFGAQGAFFKEVDTTDVIVAGKFIFLDPTTGELVYADYDNQTIPYTGWKVLTGNDGVANNPGIIEIINATLP